MARPSKSLRLLLDEFVCVRVTDMRGVNLSRYAFDFDLTFGVLVMNAEGQVLHRYGGRDERGADTWLSEASLVSLLQASLAERKGKSEKAPGAEPPARRIEEVPSFKKRDKGECIHCHSVNTSLFEEARNDKSLSADWIWKYPSPRHIGFDLDRDQQRLVCEVTEGSPAAHAGLKRGDRLLSIEEVPIASASDVMFALDRAPSGATQLSVSVERDRSEQLLVIELEQAWKRGTPLEFAWRPTKWALTPAPGFGGQQLDLADLERAGLPPNSFAFRVGYLVTWGDNRRFGQAAARAGLREGDLVTSVQGRDDFTSIEHFHAWWRLECKVGEFVRIKVLREGKARLIRLPVIR